MRHGTENESSGNTGCRSVCLSPGALPAVVTRLLHTDSHAGRRGAAAANRQSESEMSDLPRQRPTVSPDATSAQPTNHPPARAGVRAACASLFAGAAASRGCRGAQERRRVTARSRSSPRARAAASALPLAPPGAAPRRACASQRLCRTAQRERASSRGFWDTPPLSSQNPKMSPHGAPPVRERGAVARVRRATRGQPHVTHARARRARRHPPAMRRVGAYARRNGTWADCVRNYAHDCLRSHRAAGQPAACRPA
jgi:hypothetical protein